MPSSSSLVSRVSEGEQGVDLNPAWLLREPLAIIGAQYVYER
jgi:hypothetical protein